MKRKFGEKKEKRNIIYHKFINQKQQDEEDTRKYTNEMIELAKLAKVDEELSTINIYENLTTKRKTFIKAILRKKFTFKRLKLAVETVEDEETATPPKIDKNSEHNPITKLTEAFDKMSFNLQKTTDAQHANIRQTVRQHHNGTTDQQIRPSIYKINKIKIKKIETILNTKLEGTVADITKFINPLPKSIKPVIDALPQHFKLFNVLIKNEFIIHEILKHLDRKKEVNNIQTICEPKFDFEIIKTNVTLLGTAHQAVVDTGANISIISNDLAEQLELPIKIAESTNLKIANNETVSTIGNIEQLLITINGRKFPVDVIVLDNASHPILLGTNWLAKHNGIVDTKLGILTITHHNNETTTSKLDFKKLAKTLPITQNGTKKNIFIHSEETTTIPPFHEAVIKAKDYNNEPHLIKDNKLF